MGFHDTFGNGHAQPGSARLGCVKGFENAALLLDGQSGAVVSNAELQGRNTVEIGAGKADVYLQGVRARKKRVLEGIA